MTDTIRTAIIGLGNRGRATLSRYMVQPQLQIAALADLNAGNLQQATAILSSHRPSATPPQLYSTPYGWRQIAERQDIDLMVVCTDWQSHTPIATYAMRQGRDVAVEVPIATTLDECRLLTSTARQTGRYCLMMENCCYDPFHLGTLQLVRSGALGHITHCHGAYIHDLSQEIADGTYHDAWMPRFVNSHCGNPYPTHGIGPVCQILDACGGDTLATIYSAGTATGSINHSLITTTQGRTVLLDYDITTPRPYNRRQTVCGTLGFVEKYPLPTLCLNGQTLTGDDATQAVLSYIPVHYQEIISKGQRLGVPNMMNYIMDTRMVQTLLSNLPPDIPVTAAALWSAIVPLSERSATTAQPIPCTI